MILEYPSWVVTASMKDTYRYYFDPTYDVKLEVKKDFEEQERLERLEFELTNGGAF